LTAPILSRSTTAAPRWSGSGFATQVLVLTERLLRSLRDPRMIVVSIIQPLVMLTLFSQVFRSIGDSPHFPAGVAYIDYLLPAIVVTTSAQSTIWAGVWLADDLRAGLLARFRTMPIRLFSVLFARCAYTVTRNAVQSVILVVAGAALFGYRPAGGLLGTVAALLLALVFSTGLAWVFLAIGARVRNPELLQMIGMVVIFPLMFISSAFVALEGLPGWVRAVATVNPITHAIEAARGCALGDPSLAWCAAVVGVSVLTSAAGAAVAARELRRP
jgi:ABC-2 type transport system permease protein